MSGIIKPNFGAQLNRAHPLAAGLVGAWLFNEGSGNRAWDASGCENHGTLIGMNDPPIATSGWGPGPHGGALAFDGGNDYVPLPNNLPLLLAGGKFTISMTVYATSLAAVNSLIKNWGDTTAGCFHFDIGNTNKLTLYITQAGGTTKGPLSDSSTFPTGSYQSVTGVADGSYIRIYRNGIEVGTAISYDGTLKTSFPYTSVAVKPSETGNASTVIPGYLKGFITNLSIYNRALSAEEIAYLYAFPYCMFEEPGFPAWMVPNNIPIFENYYRQMRAA